MNVDIDKLLDHRDHRLIVSEYGIYGPDGVQEVVNVALECDECNETIGDEDT